MAGRGRLHHGAEYGKGVSHGRDARIRSVCKSILCAPRGKMSLAVGDPSLQTRRYGPITIMSIYQRLRANLRNDPLLQRVVRNSSYLFSSSAISAVLSAIQMIFVVRLLDPAGYGLATGIIM